MSDHQDRTRRGANDPISDPPQHEMREPAAAVDAYHDEVGALSVASCMIAAAGRNQLQVSAWTGTVYA